MAEEIGELIKEGPHATTLQEQQEQEETPKSRSKNFFNRREQRKPGRVKKIAIGTAVGVALSNPIMSEIKYDSPTAVVETLVGSITERGPHTDKQVIESVSSTLAQPDNPGADKILTAAKRYQGHLFDKYISGQDFSNGEKGMAEYDDLYKKFAREQAEKYGLTLIDDGPYKERVKNAQSVDDVFAVLNEYTSQYGFAIGIDTSGENGQNMGEIKKGADGLLSAFTTIPTELAKLGDLKQMRIVDKVPDDAIGIYDHLSEKINIEYASYIEGGEAGNLYVHELAHAIDKKLSGGSWAAGRDEEFKEPNPPEFTYGEAEANDEKVHDHVTTEEYGETNVKEDKATMGEKIFDGISPEMFNTEQTALLAKRDILLARLEERVPHITDYLRAISSKTVDYDALESDSKLLAQLASDNKTLVNQYKG